MKTVFLFIVLSFCLLFVSCGDEGAPSVVEANLDLNNCSDFAWLEDIQQCYADDTGWLPAACTLRQEESNCWLSCEGRFGEVPIANPRFVFNSKNRSFEVDTAEKLIVSCTK